MFFAISQQAAGISTLSSGFIPPRHRLTENWPITPDREGERHREGEREREVKQRGRERRRENREHLQQIVVYITQTQGIFNWGMSLKHLRNYWNHPSVVKREYRQTENKIKARYDQCHQSVSLNASSNVICRQVLQFVFYQWTQFT